MVPLRPHGALTPIWCLYTHIVPLHPYSAFMTCEWKDLKTPIPTCVLFIHLQMFYLQLIVLKHDTNPLVFTPVLNSTLKHGLWNQHLLALQLQIMTSFTKPHTNRVFHLSTLRWTFFFFRKSNLMNSIAGSYHKSFIQIQCSQQEKEQKKNENKGVFVLATGNNASLSFHFACTGVWKWTPQDST